MDNQDFLGYMDTGTSFLQDLANEETEGQVGNFFDHQQQSGFSHHSYAPGSHMQSQSGIQQHGLNSYSPGQQQQGGNIYQQYSGQMSKAPGSNYQLGQHPGSGASRLDPSLNSSQNWSDHYATQKLYNSQMKQSDALWSGSGQNPSSHQPPQGQQNPSFQSSTTYLSQIGQSQTPQQQQQMQMYMMQQQQNPNAYTSSSGGQIPMQSGVSPQPQYQSQPNSSPSFHPSQSQQPSNPSHSTYINFPPNHHSQMSGVTHSSVQPSSQRHHGSPQQQSQTSMPSPQQSSVYPPGYIPSNQLHGQQMMPPPHVAPQSTQRSYPHSHGQQSHTDMNQYMQQQRDMEMDAFVHKIRRLEERLHLLYQSRGQSPGVQQEMLDIQEQIRTLKAHRETEILLKQRHRQQEYNQQQQQSISATPPSPMPVTGHPKAGGQYHSQQHHAGAPHEPHKQGNVIHFPASGSSASLVQQSPLHHLTQMTVNPGIGIPGQQQIPMDVPPVSYTNLDKQTAQQQQQQKGSSNEQHNFTQLQTSQRGRSQAPSTPMYPPLPPPQAQHNQPQIPLQNSPSAYGYLGPTAGQLPTPIYDQKNSMSHDSMTLPHMRMAEGEIFTDLNRLGDISTPPNMDMQEDIFNFDAYTEQQQQSPYAPISSTNKSGNSSTSSRKSSKEPKSHKSSASKSATSSTTTTTPRAPRPPDQLSRSQRVLANQNKVPMTSLDDIINEVVSKTDYDAPPPPKIIPPPKVTPPPPVKPPTVTHPPVIHPQMQSVKSPHAQVKTKSSNMCHYRNNPSANPNKTDSSNSIENTATDNLIGMDNEHSSSLQLHPSNSLLDNQQSYSFPNQSSLALPDISNSLGYSGSYGEGPPDMASVPRSESISTPPPVSFESQMENPSLMEDVFLGKEGESFLEELCGDDFLEPTTTSDNWSSVQSTSMVDCSPFNASSETKVNNETNPASTITYSTNVNVEFEKEADHIVAAGSKQSDEINNSSIVDPPPKIDDVSMYRSETEKSDVHFSDDDDDVSLDVPNLSAIIDSADPSDIDEGITNMQSAGSDITSSVPQPTFNSSDSLLIKAEDNKPKSIPDSVNIDATNADCIENSAISHKALDGFFSKDDDTKIDNDELGRYFNSCDLGTDTIDPNNIEKDPFSQSLSCEDTRSVKQVEENVTEMVIDSKNQDSHNLSNNICGESIRRSDLHTDLINNSFDSILQPSSNGCCPVAEPTKYSDCNNITDGHSHETTAQHIQKSTIVDVEDEVESIAEFEPSIPEHVTSIVTEHASTSLFIASSMNLTTRIGKDTHPLTVTVPLEIPSLSALTPSPLGSASKKSSSPAPPPLEVEIGGYSATSGCSSSTTPTIVTGPEQALSEPVQQHFDTVSCSRAKELPTERAIPVLDPPYQFVEGSLEVSPDNLTQQAVTNMVPDLFSPTPLLYQEPPSPIHPTEALEPTPFSSTHSPPPQLEQQDGELEAIPTPSHPSSPPSPSHCAHDLPPLDLQSDDKDTTCETIAAMDTSSPIKSISFPPTNNKLDNDTNTETASLLDDSNVTLEGKMDDDDNEAEKFTPVSTPRRGRPGRKRKQLTEPETTPVTPIVQSSDNDQASSVLGDEDDEPPTKKVAPFESGEERRKQISSRTSRDVDDDVEEDPQRKRGRQGGTSSSRRSHQQGSSRRLIVSESEEEEKDEVKTKRGRRFKKTHNLLLETSTERASSEDRRPRRQTTRPAPSIDPDSDSTQCPPSRAGRSTARQTSTESEEEEELDDTSSGVQKRRSGRNNARKRYNQDKYTDFSEGEEHKDFVELDEGTENQDVESDKEVKVVQKILAFRTIRSTQETGLSQSEDENKVPAPVLDAKEANEVVTKSVEDIKTGNKDQPDSDKDVADQNIIKETTEDKKSCDVKEEIAEKKKEENEEPVEEYYLKYKGYSYLHCEWRTLSEIDDPRIHLKIKRFKLKDPKDLSLEEDDEDLFNPDYVEVDRVLDKRVSRKDSGDVVSSDVETEDREKESDVDDLVTEYLVKWRSLAYEDSTWELAENVDPNKVKEFLRWRNPCAVSGEDSSPTKRVARPGPKQWRQLTDPPTYKGNNKLRDYQLEGVNWLTFCWYHHRNCILADEMGLGKTVQSITFLLEVFSTGVTGPFLIIVPLSTVGNWQREFDNWADMNVVVYHGSSTSRQMIQEYEMFHTKRRGTRGRGRKGGPQYKMHAVITTYEVLMSDLEMFGSIKWRVAIIDEAHRLKNKKCKLGEGLRYLQLEHRVLLTGTPLQNNVEELFSLLNFLEPDRFPSAEVFVSEYGDLKTEEQVDSLKSLLKPMMLRRLKEDVEKSLAPKEETIVEVELTNMQKKYYRAILERNFTFLSKGSTGSGNVPNLMNTMMELRKCCNHPFLVKGAEDHIIREMRVAKSGVPEEMETEDEDEEALQFRALVYASGKLVLVHKLLPKLKSGGHKVLIFSQMIRVLDILEDYLIHQGYQYERIDGRIHGLLRQEAIDRFTNDPDKFVFLLCTKAGGIGINLTAADVVIIYDSDWNPQNDLQAQARCHRIGQKKSVNVYRLITRNSYEREMFDRASLKLGLDKAVLQSNAGREANKQPQLSKKEIEDLLKKGAYGALMEDDKAGEEFCEEDIDKILQSRSHVVKLDGGEKNSTFSKASFTIQDNRSDIDVDDPNFWQKWAKKAGIDETTMELSGVIVDEPRQRRQTNRYAANESTCQLSELDDSSHGSGEEAGIEGEGEPGSESGLKKKSKSGKKSRGKRGRGDEDEEPLDRAELFKVEKSLLTWGWGRWNLALRQATFKRPMTPLQLQRICKAMVGLSERYYNGDPRIRSFIVDLLRPDTDVSAMRRHSGLSTPVCRGRGYRKLGDAAASVGGGGKSHPDNTPNHTSNKGVHNCNLTEDPEDVVTCEGFKKHLQRASNKLLHRIQTLYFLQHEVVEPMKASKSLHHPQSSTGSSTISPLSPTLPIPVRLPRPGTVDFSELLPAPWWDTTADLCLLLGVYKHGYEKYNEMRADPELVFLSRCGGPPDENGPNTSTDAIKSSKEETEDGTTKMAEDDDEIREKNKDVDDSTPEYKKSDSDMGKESIAHLFPSTFPLPTEGLLPFPTIGELNGRFRKLIAYCQRIRYQEKFDSARRKRIMNESHSQVIESLSTDSTSTKWSRREECEFYRIVSTFGVELDPANPHLFLWRNFRAQGNLSRKSDQALTEYYRAFDYMCRAVCRKGKAKESSSPHHVEVETISEERASRCLSKIDLLTRVRVSVLCHPQLETRLHLCQRTPDMPSWWNPLQHDKELLVGVAKHGLTRMDYTLLRDPDLSFHQIAKSIQEKTSQESSLVTEIKPIVPSGFLEDHKSSTSDQPDDKPPILSVSVEEKPLLSPKEHSDTLESSAIEDKPPSLPLSSAANDDNSEPKKVSEEEEEPKADGAGLTNGPSSETKTVQGDEVTEEASSKSIFAQILYPTVNEKSDTAPSSPSTKPSTSLSTSPTPTPVPASILHTSTDVIPAPTVTELGAPVDWSVKFAANLAIEWPKDRILQGRLEAVCHCIETGRWLSTSRPAVSSQSGVTTSSSGLDAIVQSVSSISPATTPTPAPSPREAPSPAVSGAFPSGSHEMSSVRGRGRGRGRKRVTDTGPISANSAAANAALYYRMMDQQDSMGSSSGCPRPALQPSSRGSRGRKRKVESGGPGDRTSGRFGMDMKREKLDISAAYMSAMSGSSQASVDPSMAATSALMASLYGTSASSSVPSGHVQLTDQQSQVRVPVISLRDGALVYGDEAPKRGQLLNWLEENPDFMPYSVEREDVQIFHQVAKARSQDTAPMDALVYHHYLSLINTSSTPSTSTMASSAALFSSPAATPTVTTAAPSSSSSLPPGTMTSASALTSSLDQYAALYAAAAGYTGAGVGGLTPTALQQQQQQQQQEAYAAMLAVAMGMPGSSGLEGMGAPSAWEGLKLSATSTSGESKKRRDKEDKTDIPDKSIKKNKLDSPHADSLTGHKTSPSSSKPPSRGTPSLTSPAKSLASSQSHLQDIITSSGYGSLVDTSALFNAATGGAGASSQSSLDTAALMSAYMYNPFLYSQMVAAQSNPYSAYMSAALASGQLPEAVPTQDHNNGFYFNGDLSSSTSADTATSSAALLNSMATAAAFKPSSSKELYKSSTPSSSIGNYKTSTSVSSASKKPRHRYPESSISSPITSSTHTSSISNDANSAYSTAAAAYLAAGGGDFSSALSLAASGAVSANTLEAQQSATASLMMKEYAAAIYAQQQTAAALQNQYSASMHQQLTHGSRDLIGNDAYSLAMLAAASDQMAASPDFAFYQQQLQQQMQEAAASAAVSTSTSKFGTSSASFSPSLPAKSRHKERSGTSSAGPVKAGLNDSGDANALDLSKK